MQKQINYEFIGYKRGTKAIYPCASNIGDIQCQVYLRGNQAILHCGNSSVGTKEHSIFMTLYTELKPPQQTACTSINRAEVSLATL